MRVTNTIVEEIFKDKLSQIENFEDELYGFSIKHKIQPYLNESFLSRNIDPPLGLKQELEVIVNEFDNQLNYARELSNKLEYPLIVFKGFTNYFLGEGDIFKRESGDLDLLYKDPKHLRKHLINESFYEFEYSSGHEYSCLEKLDISITIDLHKHIPIMAYPKDIHSVSRNGETTIDPVSKVAELNYEDVLAYCHHLSGNVYIPSVNLSLLILCTSMFRDYISRMDSLPHFKLIDLVETVKLLNSTSYKPNEFIELVNKYNSHDSINFTGKVLKEITGLDPFHYINGKLTYYPQIQTWNFNSWFFPSSLKSAILNEDFISLYRQIGAETLFISKNQDYSFKNTAEENVLKSLTKSTNNNELQVTFNVKWDRELRLEIEISNVTGISDNDIINLNFGALVKTYFGSVSRGMTIGINEDTKETMIYKKDSKSITLTLFINVAEINKIIVGNEIPLNLYIEKYENKVEYDFLCPLIIKGI
ncbi:nucleotidyltransferase family protein [Paraliobacillus sp. X-1268]|uniref:nucleotidyltransferase family protein n=1 Tax=Paraliobacillus sp. X-1268 TaxID=2213193 RepID=UPI000E3C6268|nr:nucleotidyltransferase family protein [Paraliobacillus sp. X-1268]